MSVFTSVTVEFVILIRKNDQCFSAHSITSSTNWCYLCYLIIHECW